MLRAVHTMFQSACPAGCASQAACQLQWTSFYSHFATILFDCYNTGCVQTTQHEYQPSLIVLLHRPVDDLPLPYIFAGQMHKLCRAILVMAIMIVLVPTYLTWHIYKLLFLECQLLDFFQCAKWLLPACCACIVLDGQPSPNLLRQQ